MRTHQDGFAKVCRLHGIVSAKIVERPSHNGDITDAISVIEPAHRIQDEDGSAAPALARLKTVDMKSLPTA